jgi:NTP pyrophosphatase (non-canonical NTP hydrolase)
MINFSIRCGRWPGLGKLIEECGELVCAAGKLIVGEGQSDPWNTRASKHRPSLVFDLEDEIADVLGTTKFVLAQANRGVGGLDALRIQRRAEEKYATLVQQHREQQIPNLDK